MLERIKRICKLRGISVSELEKNSGLSPNSIYKWDESAPSITKVVRVADILGVTVDYLIRGD